MVRRCVAQSDIESPPPSYEECMLSSMSPVSRARSQTARIVETALAPRIITSVPYPTDDSTLYAPPNMVQPASTRIETVPYPPDWRFDPADIQSFAAHSSAAPCRHVVYLASNARKQTSIVGAAVCLVLVFLAVIVCAFILKSAIHTMKKNKEYKDQYSPLNYKGYYSVKPSTPNNETNNINSMYNNIHSYGKHYNLTTNQNLDVIHSQNHDISSPTPNPYISKTTLIQGWTIQNSEGDIENSTKINLDQVFPVFEEKSKIREEKQFDINRVTLLTLESINTTNINKSNTDTLDNYDNDDGNKNITRFVL